MCEKERRQRTSFDYGYEPFGENKSTPRANPFHRRAFSDRREFKRLRDTRDRSFGPITKRRRTAPHPIFDGYQLVGDSLLLRFAEQILFERCIYENGMRYLGLCVSGQTIDDLTKRIQDNFSPVGEKIILLIGTNDMIQAKHPNEMRNSLRILLDKLEKTAKKIVLLTIPPIPKLENTEVFWHKFKQYNKIVHSEGDRKNVIVQDISNLYLKNPNECNMEYFEQWYDRAHRRSDLIHLNRAGLLEIRNHLRKSNVLQSDSDTEDDQVSPAQHTSSSDSD